MTADLALIPDELPEPPQPEQKLPVARAGDFMRAADSLRLSLELADVLVDRLSQLEPNSSFVNTVRMQITRLRARP